MKNAYLKQKGSLICLTTVCKAGHTEPWFSQPFIKGMAAGNLICSGGILFTGNHFMKVNALMSACNIRLLYSKEAPLASGEQPLYCPGERNSSVI